MPEVLTEWWDGAEWVVGVPAEANFPDTYDVIKTERVWSAEDRDGKLFFFREVPSAIVRLE